MFADIEEIIRVLQLTTYDEDEGDDPINDMRKAASIINNKMDLAHSWLNDPNADAGGLGKILRRPCLENFKRFRFLLWYSINSVIELYRNNLIVAMLMKTRL